MTEKKEAKRLILHLIILLCGAHVCNTQPPRPPRNVYNFKTATWNSNGARWNFVTQLFINDGLDVLAIQEAGSIRSIAGQLSSPPNQIHGYYADFADVHPSDMGLTEQIWRVNGQTYYLYYYSNLGFSKQNMAIVTRERAEELIILPNEIPTKRTTTENTRETEENNHRNFINRPVIGVRIGHSVFFSVHSEANRERNEVQHLLDSITRYMMDIHPDCTWMAMGDYNRTPDQVRPYLPAPGQGRYIDIRNSLVSTRMAAVLDYAVVGGPAVYQNYLHAIVATVVTMVQNPSDHRPVKFT